VREAIPEAFVGPSVAYLTVPPRPDLKVALGQVRYSTDKSDSIDGAQPFKGDKANTIFGTNGNVPRVESVAEDRFGIDVSGGVTDSHKLSILLDTLAAEMGGIAPAMASCLQYVDGAFCITMSDGERIYAARDPWGLHPLAIGKLRNGNGYMVASEEVVFQSVGAEFVRDVEPGEMVILDEDGEIASQRINRDVEPRRCMYEFIYTSRVDGWVDGVPIYDARHNFGAAAARKFMARGIEVDGVIGMPDSAMPAAFGFVEESGIPMRYGVAKNPYAQRTFLLRGEHREEALSDKARPIATQIAGQRLVIVEDSMIKGNTNRVNVKKLRDAGAREVHIVIAAPPYSDECHMGMDTADRRELIAANMSEEEMCEFLGADSVTYLTPEETQQVFDETAAAYRADLGKMCMACSTSEYPFPIPGRNVQLAGSVMLGIPKIRISDGARIPT